MICTANQDGSYQGHAVESHMKYRINVALSGYNTVCSHDPSFMLNHAYLINTTHFTSNATVYLQFLF